MSRYIVPVFLSLVALATPATADDLATGAQIREALVGNTVMGSMLASGAYTEYYAPDGAIRAADYAGTWSIDGNSMCFAYGSDPATCWGARISGDQVTWVADRGDEGTGTIVAGNPNGW
jgi:hypothetical protein